MSDMDMGVTQYWALIDADGSGFLDREEFEGVMALSGVLSSQMEIDTCIEQFNVGPEEITQDVYYDWLLRPLYFLRLCTLRKYIKVKIKQKQL